MSNLWVVLGLCVLAVGIVVYLVVSPKPAQLAWSRRRPGTPESPSGLSRVAQVSTGLVGRLLSKHGRATDTETALELAGVKMRTPDFIVMLFGLTFAVGVVGALVTGSVLGALFALVAPIAVKVVLGFRTSQRRAKFSDQLHDVVQMMSGNLRAGHSLLQTLDSVAQQAPAPSSEEFTRVINETRIGRDLGQALEETAVRMDSKDMTWISQAIMINQQSGGNLSEVLDQVSGTIRERGQIRRQVKALAAEGKLSAYILMALPFGVAGFLMMTNPGYLMKFTQSLLGYGLLGIAAVLLVVGGLWLRKTVTIKF